MTLDSWSSIWEATDGSDLAQSYLAISSIHIECLSTDSRLGGINNIILDWLHPWYWMSGAWVWLVNTVLLVLEWRRLSVCNIVFSKIQLGTGFLACIIPKEVLGPISQLAVEQFLLSIDMLNKVPSLVTLLVKIVCWWWRCTIRSRIVVFSPFLN